MTILLVDSDKRALDREAQRLSRRQSGIVVVLHSSAADAEKFAMHHDVDIVNIPPQTGQQNGGNRSRVTVEMSPGVRLQVQAGV